MANQKTQQMQNSVFDAIATVAEAKVRSYKADQTIEATITDVSHSKEGRYRVSYTGSDFDAYGAANSFYVGDVVYVTVPQGDFTKQKIIIGRKVDPQSLPSTTFNFKMPFDDFIPLRNLTGEAPVAWDGDTIGFTANKIGRYIKLTDYNKVMAGQINIDECEGLTYIKSANRCVDANNTPYTMDQVKYIAGDGEEINANADYIKKLKEIQSHLNTLASNYSKKAQVLQDNYKKIKTLIEDVNYVFKTVEDDQGNEVQVRDYIKVISTGESLNSNSYKVKWPDSNGRKMSYLKAIQNLILTDFSITPEKMDWVVKSTASTTLWNRIKNELLTPYLRKFIAGNYTKQIQEIDNNPDLTDDEKKHRRALLVNADSTTPYDKLIPYFAWDSADFDAINATLEGRYKTIAKYLEDEFYLGTVEQNGHQVSITYTDAAYLHLYPATVEGYAPISEIYNEELNSLNAANRNLLWSWQGKKKRNILIETKLGISIDITTLLGGWEPTFGSYGLRFVIRGVTKTTDTDASQAVEETITFTNNDMYGNTYAYYMPYTQQKIFDISHLLTLDRIDCYFWQNFDFRDWGGVLIPCKDDDNKYLSPNILVSNLKILVGLTADEATQDRVLIYTYDDTAYGLNQNDQMALGKKLEQWKSGIEVRTEDPKSNDSKKTLQIAWIHIDEQDGPVLINHETLKHAADKQSMQYWQAKLFWYKFNWEYDANMGNEADRVGGQNWQPLDQDPAVEHLSIDSDNPIIQSWHNAHPDSDYPYSTENENLNIDVITDFTYLHQKYRAAVIANNKTYRSDVLTFTNRDSSATGGQESKLSSVVLRFLKGVTSADGTRFSIEEDKGGGNFYIYDENNNAGIDESGVPFSDIPYFVQIWTRNRETGDYQPASNDWQFGISDIRWGTFGNYSMIDRFQEPTTEDLENTALTPIDGTTTQAQLDWLKQITRKFYVKDRWDLALMDNTITVDLKFQQEPFHCQYECQFGRMGTMGSEYTIELRQDWPVNTPMYMGGNFQITARVKKRGIEVPNTAYYFAWEILSPTYTTNYNDNTHNDWVRDYKLFNDRTYNINRLEHLGEFWNRSYDTDSTEGYQGNVIKGRILNDMPLIVRVTVSGVVAYDLKYTHGFSLTNDITFGSNFTVWCPNRVEYRSDGSAPLVDMGTFQVQRQRQETEEITDDRLFVPSDTSRLLYKDSQGKWHDQNDQVTTDERQAVVIHEPILDDFIHPHWDLYAYTWANDELDTETVTETDPDTGAEIDRYTRIIPRGGPNPEADGTPGLMAGLSLLRTIGDGSEEKYDPETHGEIISTVNGDCLALEHDKRIVTSDGIKYVSTRYIDYKFSPTTNKTSNGTIMDDLEYPSFWSTTGRVYKGPAAWHWDPAYANKYYMFITWEQDVVAPGSYRPLGTNSGTYAHHHKYWFRQAIPLTQNVYSSSLLNTWDGSLLIDEANNAILAQMIAAGTKTENNTFTGVVMGDWARKGDASLDVPGMYGLNKGEQVFGLRVNGTGYIGKSGKGRIIFDGNHGIIKNADGTCYLNLDPIIIRYKNGDLGERVSTGDIIFDNYEGTSQFFLYAETEATTDTAGTESGNFAWAETIMRYSFGETSVDGRTAESGTQVLQTRTRPKDIFVVDPSNGVLTTGGVYARYGRIGKYLLLNDAGLSYMAGTTTDDKYFTTTQNLTGNENNNIIFIGQERTRNGALIPDNIRTRTYDKNYWSYLSYGAQGTAASGREQNVIADGRSKGRYIIWVGSKIGQDAYPRFGVEHDGTVHLTEAFVQGIVHASALVIGDEDADEYDRNRGIKSFFSSVTDNSTVLRENPALLDNNSIPALYNNKMGTCRKAYGDWLRPGDTWYISNQTMKEVKIFVGVGGTPDNPALDNPYDMGTTTIPRTVTTMSFNDDTGLSYVIQNGVKKIIWSKNNETINVTDLENNIKTITAQIKIDTQEVSAKKQIWLTRSRDSANYTQAQRVTALTNYRNAQATLERHQATLEGYLTDYHKVYGSLQAWSAQINNTGSTNTGIDSVSYEMSTYLINQIDNQHTTTISSTDPNSSIESSTIINPESIPTADNVQTATTETQQVGQTMSYTQFIWEGRQDTNNNHQWYGTWTQSNKRPSGVNTGTNITNNQLVNSAGNVINEEYIYPKLVTTTLADGHTQIKRYTVPAGWRLVGDVDSGSIWDALSNATLTFNSALRSTTALLATDLNTYIGALMQELDLSREEALEYLNQQRKELTNMLVNLQTDITNTVYQSAADIRSGMDPITFFDDGNCYVFLTKNPMETNIAGIGMVPSGLTIAQLPDQASDGAASTFYLNSKRMGFYRTYKEQLNGNTINVTVPLLSYYNGSMALAGSMFFGLDYNNFINGNGLTQTVTLDENGNIPDSTVVDAAPDGTFGAENGRVTLYKNYLDGPNCRIVLGNGAIVLDGIDNGKNIDGKYGNGIVPFTGAPKAKKQEDGKPYVYIGYVQDAPAGVVRIGKKDGTGIVSIADYDFASHQISSSTKISIPTPLAEWTDNLLDNGGGTVSLGTIYAIDTAKLKNLFANWTQNYPSSKIVGVTIDGDSTALKWVKQNSQSACKFPTSATGDGSTVLQVYYCSANDQLYFTRTQAQGDTEEPESGQGTLAGNYVYSDEVKFKGNKKLTYTKLIDTLYEITDEPSEEQESVTVAGYTVTYTYSFYKIPLSSGQISLKGDVLTILQHTEPSGDTDNHDLSGINLFASNDLDETKDGYVILSPHTPANSKWLNSGYNADSNNDKHWLIGWNFKGFNIYSNYGFFTQDLYAHDLLVRGKGKQNTETGHYYQVATEPWTYWAIEDFMKGPLNKLLEKVNAAMSKAIEALGNRVVDVSADTQLAVDGFKNTLEITVYKANGTTAGTSGYHNGGSKLPAYWATGQIHKHVIDLTLDFSDGAGSGEIKCAKADSDANGTVTISGLDTAMSNYFDDGWAAVVDGATQNPTDQTITITSPSGVKSDDLPADKIYNQGWNDALAAITISAGSTKTGTATNSSAATTQTITITISGTGKGEGAASLSKTITASMAIPKITDTHAAELYTPSSHSTYYKRSSKSYYYSTNGQGTSADSGPSHLATDDSYSTKAARLKSGGSASVTGTLTVSIT